MDSNVIFQAIALIVMAVFYGVYYGKMFLQKRQGIQTDLLGKGKTGLVKGIEILLKIATLLVVAVELVSIFSARTEWLWARIMGAALGAAGVAVFIVSIVTMRDSWRAGVSTQEKTALITSGIYRVSRNPAFLGFDLVYIGVLMMFFSWYLFASTAFAVIMLHLQIINVEEDHLIAAFGEEYLRYQKHVCRYLGRKK